MKDFKNMMMSKTLGLQVTPKLACGADATPSVPLVSKSSFSSE
jgi:hypothetical protein